MIHPKIRRKTLIGQRKRGVKAATGIYTISFPDLESKVGFIFHPNGKNLNIEQLQDNFGMV